MMRYLPHTPQEIETMLAAIGVPSLDALFEPIPIEARSKSPSAIDPPLDEARLMTHLEALARRSAGAECLSFLGAGIYDHHVPPAVDQMLLRGEFYTAYTPYQAEVAQGTLAVIFEFQTIVAELFGMPMANASMYDGASASAEAVLMARRLTKRDRVIVSEGLHPEYLETIRTYVRGLPGGVDTIEVIGLGSDGSIDLTALEAHLDDRSACVVLGYPNFYGCVGEVAKVTELAHARGALVVTATTDPYAMALLESPGALGVDIAVGEGQPIGLSPQFGGPGCGLFACRDSREFLQQIPGRLCGETVDQNGHRGYVLTLSTREQHIRRDRATSNICTNHSLCALAVTIRMCLLGRRGFVEVAEHCLAKAEYVKHALCATGKWTTPYAAPTFNEFVVRKASGPVEPLLKKLEAEKLLPGVGLARFGASRTSDLLIAVTEKHGREDLDRLIQALS